MNILEKANEIVKVLTEKLELKAFEIAKQYNTIGEFTRDYNAAIKALDNFVFNFPGNVELTIYICLNVSDNHL
jgi:outer membrane protein assembly factor BamD